MYLGIDVSQWNLPVDWEAAAKAGVRFAVCRLGWGNGHVDDMFYSHVNHALEAGMEIGAYLYSYALDEKEAQEEARFAAAVLKDCGVPAPAMGLWADIEDADGYRAGENSIRPDIITGIARTFMEEWEKADIPCGIYTCRSWLDNLLVTAALPENTPIWCAEWGDTCTWPDAVMWQFTDSLPIGVSRLDGNKARALSLRAMTGR